MKIRPVGAELFHGYRRRDIKILIAAFRNFSNGAIKVSDKSCRVNTNTHFRCNRLGVSFEK